MPSRVRHEGISLFGCLFNTNGINGGDFKQRAGSEFEGFLKSLCKPDWECEPIFGVLCNSGSEQMWFGCNKPQISAHCRSRERVHFDRAPSRNPQILRPIQNLGLNLMTLDLRGQRRSALIHQTLNLMFRISPS